MLAKVNSFILLGIDAQLCEVEVDASQHGMEKTVVVGLAQAAVKESLERVARAIINCGYPYLARHLLVNLAPADVKKEATALDLPIAVGIMRATSCINTDRHREFLIAGELALDGRVRKIKGGLSLALLAREKGYRGVVLPFENAREAAVVEGIEVYPVSSLGQAASILNGTLTLEPYELDGQPYEASKLSADLDFVDVRGQEAVKRAITIACAGSHNLLMIGPPGTGKSMLAARIPGILPPLSRAESLETTRIYSAMGLLPDGVALLDRRPVRTPHHSATAQALVGGGSIPRPGEVSLAHHGVLFLDELPEFSRHVLETLRQPIEGGEVTVARVHGSVKFPAQLHVGGGDEPDRQRLWRGGEEDADSGQVPGQAIRAAAGPDRHPCRGPGGAVPGIDGPEAGDEQRGDARAGGPGADGAGQAFRRGLHRQQRPHGQQAAQAVLRPVRFLPADDEAGDGRAGAERRAYDKVRRVARTIADIDGAANIQELHLAEAVQYRLLDRKF